jgi:imidazole glycerol-phosphate synthase subunit HisH
LIAILDYGMGNVRSVCNAFEYIGQDAVVTADARAIDDADHLVLPGVGAFGDAMGNLLNRGLVEILERQVFEKGKPLLGICLGLQLLAKRSEEHGTHAGLGWLDACVVRFNGDTHGLKVPHMGWNDVRRTGEHPVMRTLSEVQLTFYFVHSFHIVCHSEADVAGTCEYGQTFTAAVAHNNLFATQFHPERSQDNGLQLLTEFVRWNP